MSFIVKGGGPVNWSAVTIDADKDMLGRGLSNMKEVVLAMQGGDLIAKGLGGVLVRIPAGVANTVLTSAGLGLVPTWAPGGLYLNRYIPALISLGVPALVATTPNKTDSEAAPITSQHIETTGDLPGSMIKQLTPAPTLTDAEIALAGADQTDNEAAPLHSHFDLEQVVEGAIAEDTPAQVDETAAAKNAVANDMTLLPAVPANNDAYYFGSAYQFDNLLLNIGTVGVGVWTYQWEYYDVDTTWHALAAVVDGTVGFCPAAPGIKTVTFTRPGAWTPVAIAGVGPFYWIRLRILAYTSIVTQPLGTQAWYRIIT
jgi:hypothetical protein